MRTVTHLLRAWSQGEPGALDLLTPLVYRELQGLAASYLRRERPEHTLAPSGLVHEAFLRLVRQRDVEWQNRHHFFGLAAQTMRRVLVEHARRRGSARRRAALGAIEDAGRSGEEAAAEGCAIAEALRELARLHPQAARIVELRFFGGWSETEIAGSLGLSVPTVKRRWRLARAWLHRYLSTPAYRAEPS
jgi:RNA polymerase sigma factor (TIGR02999 family)